MRLFLFPSYAVVMMRSSLTLPLSAPSVQRCDEHVDVGSRLRRDIFVVCLRGVICPNVAVMASRICGRRHNSFVLEFVVC